MTKQPREGEPCPCSSRSRAGLPDSALRQWQGAYPGNMAGMKGAGFARTSATRAPSPEKSSAGLSSFSLRVLSKWDRSRLVGSLASSTSSGGKDKETRYCWSWWRGTRTGAHTSCCWGEGFGERAHPEPAAPLRTRHPPALAHRSLSVLQMLLEAWPGLLGPWLPGEASRATAWLRGGAGGGGPWCLPRGRRGPVLAGNAKDVPGRGSRALGSAGLGHAAAAAHGAPACPAAPPGSCSSLQLWVLSALPLSLSTTQKSHVELQT